MPLSFLDDITTILKDPSRPCFFFGSTPPREGTSAEKALETSEKFASRSAVLAIDGFIIYDIQDESSRNDVERPFPFRKTIDSSYYASLITKVSGRPCVVYKSVVEESIESYSQWLDKACHTYEHTAYTLVGAASSKLQYKGPNLAEAAVFTKSRNTCSFGCVCIPERHMSKGGEALNMIRKIQWGAEWFITQGVYAVEPVSKLINEYGDLCKEHGIVPKKVVLTFAPCGRPKTMNFLKWLGIYVPVAVEERILTANNPVLESVTMLQELLTELLKATAHSGVPLGINVESLSLYKEEIDAAHSLFQHLQVRYALLHTWLIRNTLLPPSKTRFLFICWYCCSRPLYWMRVDPLGQCAGFALFSPDYSPTS